MVKVNVKVKEDKHFENGGSISLRGKHTASLGAAKQSAKA
jgi:hypothetical protein